MRTTYQYDAPERVETVIIGGGQAGLSVGYHLARRGRRFVILEANARVGDSWNVIDYSKTAKEWMHPLKHGKEIDLVEIGANWYVDDLPPMMFMKKAPNSHGFVNPHDIEQMWRDQFDWVYREMDYAVFPITIHPDVAGRPQVLMMLERLYHYMAGHPGVKFITMNEMADDFAKRSPRKKAKAAAKKK